MIETKRATLDRTSKVQVNSVNADIDRMNSDVDEINSQGAEFNRLVVAYKNKESTYNDDCTKKYYADDMTEARKLAGL